MSRRIGPVVAVCFAFVLACAPAALARDFATTALNIVPSGQYQLSVPGASQQAEMYNGLTPLFDRVDNSDLQRYFKSEKLEPTSVVSEETVPGRPGLVIKRDAFNVPHIYGQTDADVIFGAGYVLAEDRYLLLNQVRYNGLIAAIDAPNLSAINLVTKLYQFKPTAQTNAIVERQTNAIHAAGPKGEQLLRDIDTYLEGINAWYAENQPTTEPFTRVDIYAINAIKGQFLGQGGGAEPLNSEFLDGLRSRFGTRRASGIFEDLRARNDPDTDTTLNSSAPYQASQPTGRGAVVLRDGSYAPVQLISAQSRSTPPTQASNILMVSGRRSITGRPLFVGGPQIGYFFPGLTYEVGLHGPNIDTRGVTSAPFPGYMLIGRNEDFAYTLTSAGADIIDTYAETLCGGSRTKYVYRGRCRDMERIDAGALSGSGTTSEIVFYRTVHGSVVGYGKDEQGRTVALARKRSSYGKDTLDQLFFQDLTYKNRIRSFADFARAASQTPQTFNAFYADASTTGMYTTGLLPVRPRGVDPGLPVDGRGGYEWKGYLAASRHPQGTVSNGLLVNWNNKPARNFVAGDDRFGNESTFPRVRMLLAELGRRKRHTLASVTGAMNAAATEDVRGRIFYPLLDDMLNKGKAPSTLALRMRDELVRWARARAPRLDLDGDGKLDYAGIAIMDEAWNDLADAAMCPRLGRTLCDELATRQSRFDNPPSGQYSGWYHYMAKDFRTLLGIPVRQRYSTRYCGKGNVKRCADSLWAALQRAGQRLVASQGNSDPASWREDASTQAIKFAPLPLITMAYTNRPSGIQQVISFKGRR